MRIRFKTALKDLAYTLRRALPWRRKPRAIVLSYHSIRPDGGPHDVAPEAFDWQLRELLRQGCTVVPLDELHRMLDAGHIPPRTVVLTLDDGRRDNYAHAFRILKAHALPATVFLVTGSIGGALPAHVADADALTASEVREMRSSGLVSFGSHTVTHPKLTHIPLAEAREELAESKAAVEELLSEPCPYVAYPYGRVSDAVCELARDAGYELGLATHPGAVHPRTPRFRIPRNGITASVTRAQFKGIVAHGSL